MYRPVYTNVNGGVTVESAFNGSITLSPTGTGQVHLTKSLNIAHEIQFGQDDVTLDRCVSGCE